MGHEIPHEQSDASSEGRPTHGRRFLDALAGEVVDVVFDAGTAVAEAYRDHRNRSLSRNPDGDVEQEQEQEPAASAIPQVTLNLHVGILGRKAAREIRAAVNGINEQVATPTVNSASSAPSETMQPETVTPLGVGGWISREVGIVRAADLRELALAGLHGAKNGFRERRQPSAMVRDAAKRGARAVVTHRGRGR